jgi:MFS family permease
MGGGAVVGGLLIATRNRPNIHRLTAIGAVFGVLILAVAVSPTLVVAFVLIVPMGAASIAFIATANATLQLRAEPSMRGRVMALYAIAFLGTTPIGSPLVGWISQVSSPRVALAVGGSATIVASMLTRRHHRRAHERAAAEAEVDALARRDAPVVEESEPGTELGVA